MSKSSEGREMKNKRTHISLGMNAMYGCTYAKVPAITSDRGMRMFLNIVADNEIAFMVHIWMPPTSL